MTPIWQDVYYEHIGATSLEYLIGKTSSSPIFVGKAYALPGETSIKINISRIVADYLSNNLTSLENGTYVNYDSVQTFNIYDSDSNLLGTYTFYWDWTYGTTDTGEITGHYKTGQKVIVTTRNINTGNTSNYTNVISTASTVTPYCGKYALIYQDLQGCYRSLLMEGTFKVNDELNSFETRRAYDNNTTNFGRMRYVNEINRSYELNTGWLSDAQSRKFAKNVVPSTRVYLNDIDNNTIIPVVIKETSVEHKRYANEKALISYTITVEESQIKEVR